MSLVVDEAERLRRIVAEQDRQDELDSIQGRFPGRWPRTAKVVGSFFRIGGAFLVVAALGVIAWTIVDPQFVGGRMAFAALLGTVGFLSHREGVQWSREGQSLTRRLEEIHAAEITDELSERRWFKTSLL